MWNFSNNLLLKNKDKQEKCFNYMIYIFDREYDNGMLFGRFYEHDARLAFDVLNPK